LHVATHGYFAPDSVPSLADGTIDPGFDAGTGHRERVLGFAPMVLCGLALSGANEGRDELGELRGIVTAEELAVLDLSGCELAVLSACDTNVGVRRAGLGVASLQRALHAAGARTVITSLWSVPDETTRELMVDFYRRIWVDGETKSEALWNAKMAVRARGAALRDWAGWVLSGEP
jgi:CHAT domain-containing protein